MARRPIPKELQDPNETLMRNLHLPEGFHLPTDLKLNCSMEPFLCREYSVSPVQSREVHTMPVYVRAESYPGSLVDNAARISADVVSRAKQWERSKREIQISCIKASRRRQRTEYHVRWDTGEEEWLFHEDLLHKRGFRECVRRFRGAGTRRHWQERRRDGPSQPE